MHVNIWSGPRLKPALLKSRKTFGGEKIHVRPTRDIIFSRHWVMVNSPGVHFFENMSLGLATEATNT